MNCANYVACKVSKKNSWGKCHLVNSQHRKLSILYIQLIKYIAGSIQT